ncbi:LysR family transcriptional regulator [Nocardia sp. NPDC051463]|uniref:LysR family transcriptional regulator n=1 Tax=Nocardia sp. NPDC051463 TaxID=3154845 RepID=UPI0034297242
MVIDADSLRYFLEVARTRRLVAAGQRLGVNHTTVSRRIAALERSLGIRLFDRAPSGWVLTDAGYRLLAHAEAVESALLAAMDSIATAGRLSGTVRIATPDGFGAFLLAPNLAELCAQHPDLDIQIVTATRQDVVATREFDIAVTLEPPSPRSVEVSELADYQLGLFATRGYLAAHPRITRVLDLRDHRLIGYVDALLDIPALRILDDILPGLRVSIQTNNITGQWTAAAGSLGIAVLPRYIGDSDPRLERVLAEEVTVTRKYWLVVPRDLHRLARVRTTIAMLRTLVATQDGLIPRH